jgi:hypothetical protein
MATDCAPSANNDLLGQLIEFRGARSRAADGYGQSADLGEKRVRGLVEIQGMTDDLDACASDDVACRLCVNRDSYEIFERMHYVCFHCEFEHDPYDPDEECNADGCPSFRLDAPTPPLRNTTG